MLSGSDFFKQRNKKVDYAILAAMPKELEFFEIFFSQYKYETNKAEEFEFKIYIYKNKKILLVPIGLGTTFTASIVTLIHQQFNPSYILLSGTAGGIDSKLKIRDVIIVEKAFEDEIQGAFKALKGTPFEECLIHPLNKQIFPSIYSADEELLAIATNIDLPDAGIYSGTAVSSNAFPAPKELFDSIKSKNPYSIDMETSALYQVAWLLKIRVLAIRGISNILNYDGTDDNVHQSDVAGSAKAASKVVLKILDTLILKYEINPLQRVEKKSSVSNSTEKDVAELINFFNLQPHQEGGYFAQIFQSNHLVKSTNKNRYDDENRSAGTSIYYLLKGSDFSAWHRIKSDEIWHHYRGSTIKIHVIDKKGNLITQLLGDPIKHREAVFQIIITADHWFSAELIDKTSYCLVGCTVNPGFEFKDFELADRTLLSKQFPQHELMITQLTRVSQNQVEKSRNTY